MAYSINDMNNAVNGIKNHLDARSQKRGEALAEQVLHGNLIGFFFARWFNFLTLGVTFMLIGSKILHLSEGIGILLAIVFAIIVLRTDRFWYMGFWKAIGIFCGLFIVVAIIDTL